MSVERRDNDHLVEETKKDAAEIERKVCFHVLTFDVYLKAIKMAEHLRQNEEEMTKLLAEYWKLRHQTGKLDKRSWALADSFKEVYMETLANKLGLNLQDVTDV